MNANPLKISGAFEIQTHPIRDERGAFTRIFCDKEFTKLGLQQHFVQSNVSSNIKQFTLRGLHYQTTPSAEVKLVGCMSGKVFDVIVDLREKSPTFGKWDALELSSEKMNLIYIPNGCAHGFLSLEDNCVLHYSMSTHYSTEHAKGLIWNDPDLAIAWPVSREKILSAKDRTLPRFNAKERYF